MPDAPAPEVLLAFDFGLRRIGVALGNTITAQAQPLNILAVQTRVQRFAAVADVIQRWQPNRLIVGLPLTLDGAEQPASLMSRRFANQLQGRFGLPVVLVDERGSSIEAQELVGNRPDDAQAAAVILQRYLDSLT